ncbi:ribbon-helix-helix protein, CopG family [Streptomyces albidoflavus]
MAMKLHLPDDLDAKLAERARRTGRSKQALAIEAIREAEARADLIFGLRVNGLPAGHPVPPAEEAGPFVEATAPGHSTGRASLHRQDRRPPGN